MDNIIEEFKKKLEELSEVIEATKGLSNQRGKSDEQKKQALCQAQTIIHGRFSDWYTSVGKLVSVHKLYYNEKLTRFAYPRKEQELENLGNVGWYIDYMNDCFYDLEETINLFEYRDIIGLAREFKFIDGDTALTEPDYNEIIDVIYRYGIQISRTAKTYAQLNEESIRFTILNALNVIYKGVGTGETFNKNGKTDICIRLNDINIFLAECKVLHGHQHISEGLEQILFKYLTIHDSKVALIVFNKKYSAAEAFSITQEKTQEFLQEKGIKYEIEPSEFGQYEYTIRYQLAHPMDNSKATILTTMVINII